MHVLPTGTDNRGSGLLQRMADGVPHLVHIRRVVADVDLQRAGSPRACGREGVAVLWRVHPPPHSLLLAATDKARQ